jgi:hypothetical protein
MMHDIMWDVPFEIRHFFCDFEIHDFLDFLLCYTLTLIIVMKNVVLDFSKKNLIVLKLF